MLYKRYQIFVVVAVLFFVGLCLSTFGYQPSKRNAGLDGLPLHTADPETAHFETRIKELHDIAQWKKPSGMKVIGLVFYGRRQFVSILDCYLKRNLVSNGGLLDEVIFVAKTDNEEDLAFLDELLASEPEYYSVRHVDSTGGDYSQMYKACERGNVYVKIDDDILFIGDATIRSMVKRKIEHPEYFMVSANVVVNFALSWVHLHLGAIRPYLPDLSGWKEPPTDWRPSKLPSWSGPEDFNWTTWKVPNYTRWLPVEMDGLHSNQIDDTPMASSRYDGVDWNNWLAVTQQHYSLFENLEKDELWRYGFDMWDGVYRRVSINFIAVTGDDILDMMPMPAADEQALSMDWPRKTGRHIVVDGYGVAAHNGYASNRAVPEEGRHGMENTDVLDRYRLYAEEKICPSKQS